MTITGNQHFQEIKTKVFQYRQFPQKVKVILAITNEANRTPLRNITFTSCLLLLTRNSEQMQNTTHENEE